MNTISGLAREADLPRRLVQFWADNDVLIPEGPLLPRKRALFSEREREVVRMLRPFALMSTPISVTKALAAAFRVLLTSQDPVFLKIMNNARQGETAYLIMQVFDSGGGIATASSVAGTVWELGRAIASMMSDGNKAILPVVTIDLTAALGRTEAEAEAEAGEAPS